MCIVLAHHTNSIKVGEQESLDLLGVTPSTEKHEISKEKQAEVTEPTESTAAESVSIRNSLVKLCAINKSIKYVAIFIGRWSRNERCT